MDVYCVTRGKASYRGPTY